MASPGLEPETFSVLDWRDNQLHHDTLMPPSKLTMFIYLYMISKLTEGSFLNDGLRNEWLVIVFFYN